MTIKQLSVFLENREGRLDEVLKTLGANDVNIVALSLADTAEYGMLRMIVSDPEKGKTVLKEAFTLKAVGGFGLAKAARYGISRGVFSNEAGLGSSAIIHAAADCKNAGEQGMWGILEVFIDTVFMQES